MSWCQNNSISKSSTVRTALVLFILLGASACTDYWVKRGQPPSVAEMLASSNSKLSDARLHYGKKRSKVDAASQQLELSLNQAVALVRSSASNTDIAEQLDVAQQSFIELDQAVSMGSRAALGELSGQLRTFSSSLSQGNSIEFASIGLFTARTLNFLANELCMPAPNRPTQGLK